MWPIVVSLALNSVAEFHGSFSGILGTGIIGGAVVAGDHWSHWRSRWTAERLGISLRHVWIYSQRWPLGHTDDQQCHHSSKGASAELAD